MEKHRPEKKFRAGAVSASIWKNPVTRKDGSPGFYFTVNIERNYKDKNGKWGSTGSLRTDDIPKAVLLLQKAYEFITLKELGLPESEDIETPIDEEEFVE